MWQNTGMNKGWDTAVFASRNKVAMEMKNRTIWVCVRGRNGGGIQDEFGFGFLLFCLPQTTGRIVATLAETRNSGEGRVKWKKSEFNFGHVELKCLLDIEVKILTHKS